MNRTDRIQQLRDGLIAQGWWAAQQPGQCANCHRCYGPGVVIRGAGYEQFVAECCPAAGAARQLVAVAAGDQLLSFMRFLAERGVVLCREIQPNVFVPTTEDAARLVDLFTGEDRTDSLGILKERRRRDARRDDVEP